MRIDWKIAAAAAVGVLMLFVIVKATVGYLPDSIKAYVPNALKN